MVEHFSKKRMQKPSVVLFWRNVSTTECFLRQSRCLDASHNIVNAYFMRILCLRSIVCYLF